MCVLSFEICHNWLYATDNSKDKNIIHTVLIDYSKAFDQINPIILLEKLRQFNIPDFLLRWISDFLSNTTQRVRVGDLLPDLLKVCGTVPQGTTLGVFLFLLKINNLSTPAHTFKYVADTTLDSVSNDPESTLLQEAVNEVVSWTNTNT